MPNPTPPSAPSYGSFPDPIRNASNQIAVVDTENPIPFATPVREFNNCSSWITTTEILLKRVIGPICLRILSVSYVVYFLYNLKAFHFYSFETKVILTAMLTVVLTHLYKIRWG